MKERKTGNEESCAVDAIEEKRNLKEEKRVLPREQSREKDNFAQLITSKSESGHEQKGSYD